jgi:hypothetical protein
MSAVKPKVELYRELVPLAEATAVAWHIITERPEPLRDSRQLEEMRSLVAIALSTVAPVLKRENGSAVPLSIPEVNERLFVRGGQPPQLDDLVMRRVDLLRAVELLKEAHIAFDRQDVLASIRKES